MKKFQALGAGYDPLVAGDKKIIPSIGNVFRNGQTVHVYFQVYGAAANPRNEKPAIETYLMLLKDNARILESQPQLVQDWTKETASPGGGRGALLEALRGRGGVAGLAMTDRKGEATVAISLPLKTLKKGTYTLQIHMRDLIADVNLFRRVPIVIQ
jgi:hypothetical protein